MKLIPDKVGAEPKKLVMLGALVVVLAVVYFMNRTAGPGSSTPSAGPSSAPPPSAVKPLGAPIAGPAGPIPAQRAALARRNPNSIQDFKPSLKLPEGTDVSRIDPALHLDLITKLRASALEGGGRSLFDFGAAPPKELPKVDPIHPANPAPPPPPVVSGGPGGGPDAPPAKPAPAPIPLKFYGYVNGSVGGVRQAFFLQGDDIFVAAENDLIQNRYKVIRIGVNSAVIEDTSNSNRQTIPLVQELAG